MLPVQGRSDQAYLRCEIYEMHSLLIGKINQTIEERCHLRPFAKTDLLANFKQADDTHKYGVSFLHRIDHSA